MTVGTQHFEFHFYFDSMGRLIPQLVYIYLLQQNYCQPT
jgi:hypothetical protein